MFSCEVCQFFKSTSFVEYLRTLVFCLLSLIGYQECCYDLIKSWSRRSRPNFLREVFLKILQNSQGNTWARISLLKALLKKTPAQVFSCEFCEILKSTFFIEHLWWLLLMIDQLHCLISTHRATWEDPIKVMFRNLKVCRFNVIMNSLKKLLLQVLAFSS